MGFWLIKRLLVSWLRFVPPWERTVWDLTGIAIIIRFTAGEAEVSIFIVSSIKIRVNFKYINL